MTRKTPRTYTLHLVHCNVNGLCSKLHCIQDFLVKPVQAEILLLTETHLTPLISDATVAIPGFELLRNDSGDSPKHGVCIYVKEHIKFDRVDFTHINCLSMRLPDLDLYVYVVYRPPRILPNRIVL